MSSSPFEVPAEARAAYDAVVPLLELTASVRPPTEATSAVGIEIRISCPRGSALRTEVAEGRSLDELLTPMIPVLKENVEEAIRVLLIESGELPRAD